MIAAGVAGRRRGRVGSHQVSRCVVVSASVTGDESTAMEMGVVRRAAPVARKLGKIAWHPG